MRKLELLAPAKNLECGMAAIDHGADAVYIGPPQFGARVAAGNSVEDISRLCSYAHQYGVRVYATVNTLLYDEELPQAQQLIRQLVEVGVDAILIQDMRLAPSNVPPLGEAFSVENTGAAASPSWGRLKGAVFHASTQADNRTAEKVAWLWQRGFRRAVLARELSVEEIAAIHLQVPQIELEVFVHGALCVSFSGLCYASEYCFRRSANRGECAQFCRMKFDLLDADGRELQHQRHLLSLKDLNLSAHLGRLIEAGAMSFKIEGRLKDISYVKNVTAAYSQLLDRYIAAHPGLYERASLGRCRYTFKPDLNRTFNRGYTTYFVDGRQPSMASFDTPKAIGQYVGKVKELRDSSITVAGTASFANGDGLCFFSQPSPLTSHLSPLTSHLSSLTSHLSPLTSLKGFRVNRVEGNRLYPASMPEGLKPGVALYRSSDQAMERELSKQSAERRIPVTMSLSAVDEDGFCGFQLTMSDGQNNRTVRFLADHQLAKTPQRDNIVRELSKLGNTPYECTSVDIPAHFPYFIPVSQLAAARRSLTPSPSRGGEGSIYTQGLKTIGEQEKELSTPLPPAGGTGGGAFGGEALMQCRYCLRYELGICLKHQKPSRSFPFGDTGKGGPLFLRLADGRRFHLEFDCRQCQMKIYADDAK